MFALACAAASRCTRRCSRVAACSRRSRAFVAAAAAAARITAVLVLVLPALFPLEILPVAATLPLILFSPFQLVQVVSVAFRYPVRRSALIVFATLSSFVAHAFKALVVEFLFARFVSAAWRLGFEFTSLACAMLSAVTLSLGVLRRALAVVAASFIRLRARRTSLATCNHWRVRTI